MPGLRTPPALLGKPLQRHHGRLERPDPPVLREKGGWSAPTCPSSLASHCGRLDDVVNRINAGYIEYAVRGRRMAAARGDPRRGDRPVRGCRAAGRAVGGFSRAERVDTEAARASSRCEEFGLMGRMLFCLLGRGRSDDGGNPCFRRGRAAESEKWEAALSELCGRSWIIPW